MRTASTIPFAMLALALVALWAAGRGGETPQVVLVSSPAASVPMPPVPTAGVAVARTGVDFVQEVFSMADVHRLREQTRAAEAGAVPELRRLALTVADVIVASEAIEALGRLGALAADAELLALADDPRPRVRQAVVLGLGHPGTDRGIELLRRIAVGTDADLRPLAIAALGRVRGAAAAAALRELAARVDLGEVERGSVGLALQQATRPGSGRRIERSLPVVDAAAAVPVPECPMLPAGELPPVAAPGGAR